MLLPMRYQKPGEPVHTEHDAINHIVAEIRRLAAIEAQLVRDDIRALEQFMNAAQVAA